MGIYSGSDRYMWVFCITYYLAETCLIRLKIVVNKNNNTQNPTAVIFNLGVNDLSNLPSYVTYMKSLASTLKKKNCKLFYMSVNPGNSKMMENTGHVVRSEAAVRQFNSTIRSQLASDYTFIDTYSWLLKNGYGTNASGSRAAI